MVLATDEPQWLNNEIIVFYVSHRFLNLVEIKGILDMDYYEEKDRPLQFYDWNKELQWEFPPNPFEFPSAEYRFYNEAAAEFKKRYKDIVELLEDCCGVEHHDFECIHIEMESLTWK